MKTLLLSLVRYLVCVRRQHFCPHEQAEMNPSQSQWQKGQQETRQDTEFSLSKALKATLWIFLTLNQNSFVHKYSPLQLMPTGLILPQIVPPLLARSLSLSFSLSVSLWYSTSQKTFSFPDTHDRHIQSPECADQVTRPVAEPTKPVWTGKAYGLRRSNILEWCHLFHHGPPQGLLYHGHTGNITVPVLQMTLSGTFDS